MIKYKIVAVGNIKEQYFAQAVDEYVKRMSRFVKTEICEVAECNFRGAPKEADIKRILTTEAKAVLSHLEGYVVVLDINGKLVDSTGIATALAKAAQNYSVVTFVIGGSYGLSDEVKQRADARWSLGAITMPHRLARVVLVEQLYRASTINNNIAYHK